MQTFFCLSAGAGRRGGVIHFIRPGDCPYQLSRARIIDASTAASRATVANSTSRSVTSSDGR